MGAFLKGDRKIMYAELKDKFKKEAIINRNTELFLSQICEMFDYSNMNGVKTEYIDIYLNMFGSCAIWKNGENFVVSMCTRIGDVDENGKGKDLLCTTMNGKQKTFKNFEVSSEVVFFKNDKFALPDLYFETLGELLGEVDVSLLSLVKNTRLAPIFEAPDEKAKIAFDKILTNIEAGKISSIVSENLFGERVKINHLTEVEHENKIQYLTQLVNDINKRFWDIYGLNYSASQKRAQQTVDETNSGSNVRTVIPYQRKTEREKAIKRFNEIFNMSASVDFSKSWKDELNFVNENLKKGEYKNNDDIQNLGTVEE